MDIHANEALILRKVEAGLTREQAIAVLEHQLRAQGCREETLILPAAQDGAGAGTKPRGSAAINKARKGKKKEKEQI